MPLNFLLLKFEYFEYYNVAVVGIRFIPHYPELVDVSCCGLLFVDLMTSKLFLESIDSLLCVATEVCVSLA